jgi:hypothetical protein
VSFVALELLHEACLLQRAELLCFALLGMCQAGAIVAILLINFVNLY